MAKKAVLQMYEAVGKTLEIAVTKAHSQIPSRPGRDFVICRVLEWGYQRGGIADAKLFYARVVEDEFGPLKT